MKLAGALEAAAAPGLSKTEVHRLQVIANLAKTYKEILADYLDYRGIEEKMKEMEARNTEILARMEKKNPIVSVSIVADGNAQTEGKSAPNPTPNNIA
jgi:hypothetical protein